MAENSFVKISVLYKEGKVSVSSAIVNSMGDRITLRGEDFDLIPHQSAVEVIGYLEDGVVFMDGKVTLSTESQLNIDVTNTGKKKERRSFLKVKANISAELLRAFSLGRRSKGYSVRETIQTRDISLGGMAFYSSSVLFKKQKVEIDFDAIKPGFIARAEVLRKEKVHYTGEYRFKYACRFLGISGEEERVLCEFVLRKQLENRQKLIH